MHFIFNNIQYCFVWYNLLMLIYVFAGKLFEYLAKKKFLCKITSTFLCFFVKNYAILMLSITREQRFMCIIIKTYSSCCFFWYRRRLEYIVPLVQYIDCTEKFVGYQNKNKPATHRIQNRSLWK